MIMLIHDCEKSHQRRLVYLLESFEKLGGLEKNYLLSYKDVSVWYDSVLIGWNKLKTYLESMCQEACTAEKKNKPQLEGNWSFCPVQCLNTWIWKII